MFFRKKQERKTGIIYKHTFDGIEMKPEIQSGPPKETKKTLESIKDEPRVFRFKVQERWVLDSLPNMQIKHLDPPTYIEENDIDIIAEIHCTHDITIPKQKMRTISKMFFALIAGLVMAAIGIGFGIGMSEMNHRSQRPCVIQYLDGRPNSIRIDSSEYKLQSDGTMDRITRIHMNPWHQEIINSGRCARIDL